MFNVTVIGAREPRLEAVLKDAGATARFVSEQAVAAQATKDQAGEVYLLDLRDRLSLPPWLGELRRHAPSAAIVVLLSSLDPAQILEAMRSGVNECIPDPVTDKALADAFERLSAQRPTRVGRCFAFIGAKGGVGTTTAAVNVGTVLSGRDATLLMDLHLAHGDAGVLLGIEPRFSVVDALENTQRLDKAFFHGLISKPKVGPDVLPSSDRTFVPQGVGHNIRQVVDFVSQLYPFTVLDVPRSEATALDALDGVTKIVLVANQELSAVRNAARIADTLRQRYGSDRLALLISRYDPESEIGQDDLEKVTGIRGALLVPSDYRLALQALNSGRPLTIDNHTKLAGAFRQVADRLAGKDRPVSDPAPNSSLLGRLLGRRS